MIPTYKVDAEDMLNWARYIEEIPKVTNAAIARGLNTYGDGVLERTAAKIADKADLQVHEVMATIVVTRATPRRLEWSMDASGILPPSGDWSRPWATRDQNQFDKQVLVNITTMHDRFSCEVCEQAAASGPYTMADIDTMVAKWKNFEPATGPAPGFRTNLIHPNCRCVLTPFANKRRLRVTFGAGEQEMYTAKGLADAIAGELKVSIKAVKKRAK
jgi:hypothetical protein